MAVTRPDDDPVGSKYVLPILDTLASEGPMRYMALSDAVGVPSSATFSNRLSQLERCGLVERESFDEVPPHVEYRLTEDGEAFREHLTALYDIVA